MTRHGHLTARGEAAGAVDAAAQLPLRLVLAKGRRFGSFEVTPDNAELVDAVRRIASDRTPERVLIAGDPGAGKSHLLEAACATASAGGDAVAFVPMREWRTQGVDDESRARALRRHASGRGIDIPDDVVGYAVHGLGRSGLLCVDDVDAVAGDREWEEALLALVETCASGTTRLLVSARASPSNLRFALADLQSRLSAATVYRLRELDDESRARALRRHASGRGIDIPDDVVGYVLTRHRRDMASLVALLDRLDYHSMAHQRRLTVPFVRGLIETD